jgi:hypothetical protein
LPQIEFNLRCGRIHTDMRTKKPIESLILTIRGQKVILDTDLAGLYGVPTKALNQASSAIASGFPKISCSD